MPEQNIKVWVGVEPFFFANYNQGVCVWDVQYTELGYLIGENFVG